MKVLIAYDDSPFAQAALRDLRRAGIPRDAELMLLAVADVELGSGKQRSPARALEEASQSAGRGVSQALDFLFEQHVIVEQVCRDLRAENQGWKMTCEARPGSPVDVILETAGDMSADLICLGAHGRSRLGQLVFGSVSAQVMRRAQCPVRVTRSCREPVAEPPRLLCYLGTAPDCCLPQMTQTLSQRAFPPGTDIRVLLPDLPRTGSARVALPGSIRGHAVTPYYTTEAKDAADAARLAALELNADCILMPKVDAAFPDYPLVRTLLCQAACSVEVIPVPLTAPAAPTCAEVPL